MEWRNNRNLIRDFFNSRRAVLLFLLPIVLLASGSVMTPEAMAADYDTDDNGLIEIDTPEKLLVVKYDLDGNGTADSVSEQTLYQVGFPDSDSDQCPDSSCIGYELNATVYLNYDGTTSVIGDYTGDFNGNDYTIHNITVNSDADYVGGLFDNMRGNVSDLHLVDVSVTANSDLYSNYAAGGLAGFLRSTGIINNVSINSTVYSNNDNAGGLVGYSSGSISNSHAYSNVTSDGGFVGGLAGYSDGDAISDSYAYGNVTAGDEYAGGLVGSSTSSISNSHAYGTVTTETDNAGGLVGESSSGSISNSSAYGTVTAGNARAGGLVGESGSSISNSHANGTVTAGGISAGGLVGYSTSSISNSHAYSNVTAGDDYAGGLVAYSEGVIRDSYAHATVRTGDEYAGGLVGYSIGDIITSYAFGNVDVKGGYAGGLVGYSKSDILASYAVGNVSSVGSAGGLTNYCPSGRTIDASYAVVTVVGTTKFGLGSNCTIKNSYWSTDASPDIPADSYSKTNTELKAPTEYGTGTDIYADWNVTGTDAPDDTGPWLFGDSEHLPYLYWQSRPNFAPTIDPIDTGAVYPYGDEFSILVTSSDADGDTLTHTLIIDPNTSEITIDSGTGTISGSTATPAGTYTATVTVTDTYGATATSNEFSFIVNTAPTIESIATGAVYLFGTEHIIPVTVADDDEGDSLTLSMTPDLSAHGITIDSANRQILISVTTPADEYTATVTVTDTYGATDTSNEFSFIVNTAPTIESIATGTVYLFGTEHTIPVTVTDDDEGDTLTLSMAPDLSAHGITIDSANRQILISATTPANEYTATVIVTDTYGATDTSNEFSFIVNTAPTIESIATGTVYLFGTDAHYSCNRC